MPIHAPELSPRRRQLVEAAVRVVAAHGLRGLTHRAVDREAGLPEGSCSAYLRTRRALQFALAEHVAGSLTADVALLSQELAGCDGMDDRAVEVTSNHFLAWVEDRDVVIAKNELTLEASRDPELAELLATYRTSMIEVVDDLLTARGKNHSRGRAEALVASVDGVLAAALLKPDDTRRTFVTESLGVLLGSLSELPDHV